MERSQEFDALNIVGEVMGWQPVWALVIGPTELIGTGGVLVLGTLIAAVLLRGGVRLANWLTGEERTLPTAAPEVEEWSEYSPTEKDLANPYSAPSITSIAVEPAYRGVPFRRACLIGLVQSLASYGVVIAAMVISVLSNSDSDWWVGPSAGLFVLSLVNARILCRMLPTTYRRGLIITLFQFFVGALILSPLALLQV